MIDRRLRCPLGLLTASVLFLGGSNPARGVVVNPTLTYNGGNGDIVFGVAPYGGAPVAGGPTYIANNFTGRSDILASPGMGTLGGYLTANPVVANNIASYAGATQLGAFQIGGNNGVGNFGAGAVVNYGPLVGLSLADAGAGGGTASYEITSANISYTVGGAAIPVGTSFGAYLSMAGSVPLLGNADVEALRVHVSDSMGVLGAGGTDLPQLVLAISNNGAGAYNIVNIGGAAGANAKILVDNAATGAFRGLAVDNLQTSVVIPVNDVLTVSYTLTAYADPASFSSFDPTNSFDLLDLTGPLPTTALIGTAAVPEPASLLMMGLGVVGVLGLSAREGRRRRKAG